jgi:hypothetical protein
MQNDSYKFGPEMPLWARVISAVSGAVLSIFGVLGLIFIRPFSWQILFCLVPSVGLGADLLQGAVRGRWPVLCLGWLI